MSDIGGLQLLPTQKRKFSIGKFTGNNLLLSIAFLLLISMGVIYSVLYSYTNKTLDSIDNIDTELAAIYESRDKAQEEKLANFKQQTDSMKTLLVSHVAWVDGFQRINGLIEPRVTLMSLSADSQKRTYTFNAVADSYSTVAKQISSFYKSPDVSDIVLNSIKIGQGGKVEFSMVLNFKPDHFLFNN